MAKFSPTPIASVIKTVFKQIETEKVLTREDVEAFWRESAGDGAAKHARPVALRQGVLTVQVDSSAWMQELAMKKRPILKALKRKFGQDKILNIHLKMGDF